MWAWLKYGLILAALPIAISQNALAQNKSDLPSAKISNKLLSNIGLPAPNQTLIRTDYQPSGLPVKLIYDGPKLIGTFQLIITISKQMASGGVSVIKPVSQSTLYLDNFESETSAVVSVPEQISGLQIKAVLRDENQNLVLETEYPLPILSNELRLLKLTPPTLIEPSLDPIPDFTGIEIIKGKIILPRETSLPDQSKVHIQLLENALAGGLSLQLAAQDTRLAVVEDGVIPFTLERGVWERRDDPDLAFKAWVTDAMGRKIYVMSRPVNYNGPGVDYVIRLDSLKQGRDTKRGRTLNPDLMAQTLVQGEAEFDPVNGIPGQARLQIKLRQDRGEDNLNPILAEQTLILRGMETRIPFSLTTDSTHFDPYAPAPFISVALTDSFGRIYYASGEIRAREGDNKIRLYPR